MARPKKQVKAKEPVRLRFNKLNSGNTSIYLDIYHDGRRSYQFLKLYLVPETDYASKIQNANTLATANAIKSEKILELTNKVAGITDRSYKAKMLFTDWMRVYHDYVMKRGGSKSASTWINRSIAELEEYNGTVTLAEVDRDYLLGFMERLLARKAYTRDHGKLAKETVFMHMDYLRAALNYAVKENLLQKSPYKGIKRSMVVGKETKREYLTVDEVKRLIKTPCRRPDMKAAFLFSCFCGLRIMDIKLLCWKNIIRNNGKWQVEITQYKTGVLLYLPLNMNARKWLPEQGDASPEDPVFPTLSIWYKHVLSDWAKNAGIDKKFSFHVARHTFGSLITLEAGVPIETISKMLGHTNLTTTQLYARVTPKKLFEDMDKFIEATSDMKLVL